MKTLAPADLFQTSFVPPIDKTAQTAEARPLPQLRFSVILIHGRSRYSGPVHKGDKDSGSAPSDVHQLSATKVSAVGLRYTANRRAVVEALLDYGPATINDILKRQESLAQSSAYRTLSDLERAGVVERLITEDDHARYELAEEVTGHHHHHLVCRTCGAILDVVLDENLDATVHNALTAAAREHRFQADHHRIDLVGQCERCWSATAT